MERTLVWASLFGKFKETNLLWLRNTHLCLIYDHIVESVCNMVTPDDAVEEKEEKKPPVFKNPEFQVSYDYTYCLSLAN